MSTEKLTTSQSMVYGLEQLPQVVDALRALMRSASVFTFTGSLGAGKTTLIRALLNACGVQEPITSPTFNYVNIYTNDRGEQFYHFDLYRIKSLDEFCLSGFDEYLYLPNSWAFIEWPELILPLLKEKVCNVSLAYVDRERRVDIRCS